jgi:uncharacterized protein (TIGR00369 family)
MDQHAPTLGCEFLDRLSFRYLDEPGSDATLVLDVTDDVRGPNGGVHAGITSMIADVAGAMAIANRTGRRGASASVSVHLLAPAKIGPLRAVANVLKASRHSAAAEVHIYDVGNDDRLVAAAHMTSGLFDDPPSMTT